MHLKLLGQHRLGRARIVSGAGPLVERVDGLFVLAILLLVRLVDLSVVLLGSGVVAFDLLLVRFKDLLLVLFKACVVRLALLFKSIQLFLTRG